MPTYLSAALLARTGDEGAKLAVMLLALAVATPSVGGYGVACLMAPHVLAAPVMGRWIDRSEHPHRILALAAEAFAALLAVACASLGRLPDLAVMGLLLAAGLFGPAITGGLSSLVRLLTTEDQLPRAFGMDSLVYNIAGMIGPAVAAAVAVSLPRGAGYLVAGLVAAAAVPLLLLRPRTATGPAAGQAPRPSILGGLRSIRGDRPLALATAGTSIAQMGAGALAVALPLRAHAMGIPLWAGWWFAGMAGGALLGSVAWTVRPAPAARAFRVVMVALAFTGIALLAAALVEDRWLVLLALVVAGFANGPQFGALQVVRDRGAGERDRAGVFTLAAGIKVAAAALGTAVAGQLAGLSPTTLLLGAAAAPIVGGLLGLVFGASTGGEEPTPR